SSTTAAAGSNATGSGSGSASAGGTTGGGATTAGNQNVDLNATPRVSTTLPPTSLHPRTSTGALNPYPTIVFERLLQVDSELQLRPMLAESWKFSTDGTQLILKLRDDVTFHSGAKLDANAVKASLDRWKSDPKSLLGPSMAGIASVAATDPT